MVSRRQAPRAGPEVEQAEHVGLTQAQRGRRLVLLDQFVGEGSPEHARERPVDVRDRGALEPAREPLIDDAADVPGEPNVRDWALETLRLVEHNDEKAHFEPASIPAYTKDGFERVQKLKLTPDEAQFASQFNGTRSVQQIAKNLRLDLKSARQMLFRFVALEIVECWPASTAAKPEQQSVFQRFGRKVRRDR